jgi:hypothetical protein
MLGLFPLEGTEKLNAVLPLFSTVTVCGLSLLVEPGAVGAKLRLGESAKSSFAIRLLYVSAMTILPLPATVTPDGPLKVLVATVLST